MKVKEVMLFANGQIAAFDESNQQIELLQQRNAIELFAEYAKGCGYEIDGCRFSTQIPAGSGCPGTIIEHRDCFSLTWDK